MTVRKYPHPGFEGVSQIDLKIWEIRNQLEFNIELMQRTCPVDPMMQKIFGHPIEIATIHVFDRLNELEQMVKNAE